MPYPNKVEYEIVLRANTPNARLTYVFPIMTQNFGLDEEGHFFYSWTVKNIKEVQKKKKEIIRELESRPEKTVGYTLNLFVWHPRKIGGNLK